MPPVDLLSWPELHAAELRATAAEREVAIAKHKYRNAPHGRRQKRLMALQTASQQALRAQVELARLSRDLGA